MPKLAAGRLRPLFDRIYCCLSKGFKYRGTNPSLGENTAQTGKVDWKHLDQDILDAIKGMAASGYTEQTIRSVYYILGTKNIIPLTKSGYKSLDAKMVTMRQEGKIPWGTFAVKRGRSVEGSSYFTPDQWANYWIRKLKTAHETFSLPRWYGQNNLVEVWVEKDGLLGATANWVSDLDITVRAPQGQGAWEFIHEAMKNIMEELEAQGKTKVNIIYLGDLDPSGMRIPYVLSEKGIPFFQEHFGMADVEFTVIALNAKQVKQNNLPEMPESDEVLEKINRDPNLRWYKENYPEDMFTELDAFYALATAEAKRTIREAVEDLFDDAQFQKTRRQEKNMREKVKDIVDDRVEFKED